MATGLSGPLDWMLKDLYVRYPSSGSGYIRRLFPSLTGLHYQRESTYVCRQHVSQKLLLIRVTLLQS